MMALDLKILQLSHVSEAINMRTTFLDIMIDKELMYIKKAIITTYIRYKPGSDG